LRSNAPKYCAVLQSGDRGSEPASRNVSVSASVWVNVKVTPWKVARDHVRVFLGYRPNEDVSQAKRDLGSGLYARLTDRRQAVSDSQGAREALAIEIDTSLPAGRVIRMMEPKSWRGLPKALRLDNGPEFLAGSLWFGVKAEPSTMLLFGRGLVALARVAAPRKSKRMNNHISEAAWREPFQMDVS
jgi:hypothetical protein